jgi:hypothetical protein
VAIAASTPGAQQPALVVSPAAGPVSLTEAQQRADFVIYLPTYLPPGAGQPRLTFAPEETLPDAYVPNRIYIAYAGDITLWQMPTIGRPLRHPAVPISLGGRTGWVSDGPGARKTSLEWRQGDTQLGITAPLPIEELFKIAGSAVQAAPQVPMAAASAMRHRHWSPETKARPPVGGIGVMLAPGAPPTVSAVQPATPAAEAGIQPGDVIAAVEGRPTAGLSMTQTMNLVRGTPGTTVRITLRRAGARSLDLTLRREALPAFDVTEVTLAQARALAPFTIYEPAWLPPGYRLLTCAVVRRDGKPWQARLVYHAVGRPLLLISETKESARPFAVAPGKGTERVRIAAATGLLNLGAGTLSWSQGGTAISLQSRALQRDMALNIARSMR